MGTGFHGGFGLTKGYRNRIGHNVEITKKSIEMALNPLVYIKSIVEKYGINLKTNGKSIKIIYDPELNYPGICGRVFKGNPYTIFIARDTIQDEIELARTIAHELNHCRSFAKGGNAPEDTARFSELQLYKYSRGKK